ncbi:LTA synthase family protein [Paenibacillus alkalitolerans]|uniref:LTA synthase family protein n=1 Tax=Paenibacillus alkalitolerans TaxID=2799335 RepID=UPI0018F357A1|nr:LTA synthase family protein [Paenibacillus alkalitolerans]
MRRWVSFCSNIIKKSFNGALASKQALRRGFFNTPFFLFTMFLTIKYYGLQIHVFGNYNPLQCLAVALPSLLLFLIPVELGFRRKKSEAYLVLNALLSAAMVSVIVYYRQFGIVVTYRAFSQAHQVLDVSDSILDLLQPLYLLFFLDIIIWLILTLWKSAPKLSGLQIRRTSLSSLWALCFMTLVLFAYSYDGVLNELKQAERMGLVSYQVHTLVSGVRAETATAAAQPVTPDIVRSVKNLQEPELLQWFGAAKGRNLIVVQLESFQNFLVGMEIGGKPVTPVMNELLKDSFYFSNVYQQISQGNTSDAEFMMNTSFYPPAHGAASQTYGIKRLPSLPRILKGQGYTSITLHTNEAKFWNRSEMYPALGFDRYYDKRFFGEEDIIAFGASDEVLYRKTSELLSQLKERDKPFYAHVIAMSSHHPFLPPPEKEMMQLPEEWEGTDVGNYLKLTNYADRALGQFFEQLKAAGLWEQSMLVVYGDHFGLSSHSLKANERELLEAELGKEYDARTVHNIPLVIMIPGVTDGGQRFDNVGGQVDFMPTVANLLGLSLKNHVIFGQDLLNYRKNVLGSRYYLPTGSFINNDIMYISGESFGEGTVLPLHNSDPQFKGDPELYKDDFIQVIKLLQLNDAYLESLPERRLSF